MGESEANQDSLTLEGLGGLYNGEVFVLVPGQSGTVGRSSIATFPVTICRNYKRLDGDPTREGLLEHLHPEHVRILYVGGGRVIVENLSERFVSVANRDVSDRIDVDLAEGGIEIRFGYGERILATCPTSKDELQEFAPPQDMASAVEGVFMALLRPDGTLAIGSEEPEYELLPIDDDEPTDAEGDTGPIPELTEAEIARARRKQEPRRWYDLFRRSPAVFLSVLFHLVVVLGLFSTLKILEVTSGEEWNTEVSVVEPEAPTTREEEAPEPVHDATDPSEEAMENETPTVEETHSEAFPDAGSPVPGEETGATGVPGLVGVGAGGVGAGGPLGSGANTGRGGGRGGRPSGPLAKALAWLATHQSKDGSWGGIRSIDRCGKCTYPGQRDYAVAMTGLGVLAFVGGGNTHRDGKYRRRVLAGVRWLIARQEKDGSFHPKATHPAEREMYGDAIATLALAELYRTSNTTLVKAAVLRSIRHLERSQSPYAGWRYQPGAVDSDTSVTAWAILALSSANRAGIDVNPMVWAGGRAWLSDVTENGSFRIGYNRRGRGSLGMTAAGLVMMHSMDREYPATPIRTASALLRENPPRWPQPGSAPPAVNPPDINYWFFGTVAARKAGGLTWKTFSRGLKKAFVENQESHGHARGSFPPPGRWSRVGGRVYTTATAAICLSIEAGLKNSLR